jgi:flagellar basal body-associated protein FliL
LPERVLTGILAILIIAITLGTIWALAIRPQNIPADKQTAERESSTPVFTGIGRLRARLAPPVRQSNTSADNDADASGAAVIIAIEFPYNAADRSFLEELSLNVDKFRSVTLNYFASIPADSSLLAGETALKQVLLSRYNDLLYLGKIKELYFSEFMIID